MTKTISHQFFFPHSVEKVWECLTTAELMSQWLMKNDFQPILGFEFQFRTNPMPALDFDGIFYCKVLEIIPFKTLSYSWQGGPGEGKIALDSVVVWKLQSTEKGTDVFLEHKGFKEIENLNFYTGMNDGWLKKLQNIAGLLKATEDVHTHP